MIKRLGVDRECIRKNLKVQNLRGDTDFYSSSHKTPRRMPPSMKKTDSSISSSGINYEVMFSAIEKYFGEFKADIIAFDPIYKLLLGENDASSVKPLLAFFDRLSEAFNVTVIGVHHMGKGSHKDVELIDRGVGSGVLQRDFDSGIFLGSHKKKGLVVCEQITRNHPQKPAFSMRFKDGLFVMDNSEPSLDSSGKSSLTEDDLLEILSEEPLSQTELKKRLKQEGFSLQDISGIIKGMLADKSLKKWRESTKNGKTFVGLPEDIDALAEQ
jgi:RNA recognition motif-containing protein